MSKQFDLRGLIDRLAWNTNDPFDIETQITQYLDSGLNGTSTPRADTIVETAEFLDQVYGFRDTHQGEDQENFFQRFWTFILNIAKLVPADSNEHHDWLVDVIRALKGINRPSVKIWREDVVVWGGLPLLGPCLRDMWNCKFINHPLYHPSRPWPFFFFSKFPFAVVVPRER